MLMIITNIPATTITVPATVKTPAGNPNANSRADPEHVLVAFAYCGAEKRYKTPATSRRMDWMMYGFIGN